jgi:hypothetical protein
MKNEEIRAKPTLISMLNSTAAATMPAVENA